MSHSRYQSYRDSGVEWIGEVPAHWEVARLGSLFTEIVEPGSDELPVLSVSIHSGVSDDELAPDDADRKITRSEDRSKYKRVQPGDLVYNMMRAWQGGFGSVNAVGAVSPAYVVARPIGNVPAQWIERTLRTPAAVEEMRRHSKGVTDFRLRLYWDDFKNLRVALPPAEEFTAITAFLDHETAKIDALVEEQQRLIGLLKEKRQAVISCAVTKGLDPFVPMKESGVESLGAVPAHWLTLQARRIVAKLEQGWSPECLSRPAEADEWGVLKSGCVNGGVYREEENKALPPDLSPENALEVREGDVLMSRASGSPDLIGSAAYVTTTRGRIVLSDKIFRLACESCVLPKFLMWMFASSSLRGQIVNSISGADGMANNLPQSRIKEFRVCLPPLIEQRKIIDYLDEQTSRFDRLVVSAEEAVLLLLERRAALICAAVTGKIDVREVGREEEAA